MPKINVYLPDDLAEAVREAGVPVSAICQRALETAVRRVTAIRETTLGDLDTEDPTARLTNFTARARAALKLGIQQARDAGTPTVGTAHVLGGLLAEGGNLALQVLRSLDIEPAQVRGELDAQPPERAASETSRFSDTAANALELTVTEAHALGHNYVGCEHLLLGLIAEPEGTAGRVLRSLGAELRLTRRAVSAALAVFVHARAQQPAPTDVATAVAVAVRQELQPLTQRIERLERRVGAVDDS